MNITVAIPTYRREQVLLDTLRHLLQQDPAPAEILVVDQSEGHDPSTAKQLQDLATRGAIRWLRLDQPSIPKAMNEALLQARNDIVLFLDDDIRPEAGLVAAHGIAHQKAPGGLVAGKVLQPWDEGVDYSDSTSFHFATSRPAWIAEFMGGNFSVDRALALQAGGFDENFVQVAYKFEAEFAHRWLRRGRRIWFEPQACLHHLKVAQGGTRTYGEHLMTWRPGHAVGAYYFALRTRTLREFAVRPLRSVATRYHLRHPWRIPATLLAEFGGMSWALWLFLNGPRHAKAGDRKDPG